jgi:A118 family predicted phage portal protein
MAVDDRQMSLLPVTNRPWPPPEYDPITYQMRLWSAWFSGDDQMLSWAYYNLGANSPAGRAYFSTTGEPGLPTPRPGQYRGGLLGSITRTFWGQPVPPGEKRTKYHVPIAGDIAQTSADLLFSSIPAIKCASTGNQAAVETLMDDSMHVRFLEAAELDSALGGVYLRVVWDTDVSPDPWIEAVPSDCVVPEFSHGKLVSATFWRIISDDGTEVVRHLEKHVPGSNAIFHGVYRGDQTDLGRICPLTDFPETAQFAQYVDTGDAITFPDMPLDASTVVYIPNVLPNRIWRELGPQAQPLGRSDYSGVESLMDALDETYSSLMRDIQLAKARLIVPQQFLDNIGKGQGAVFDTDRQVYSPVSMMTGNGIGGTNDIMANQFAIRVTEHLSAAGDLVNRIVQGAGYSGQTFGEYDEAGGAMTATEIEAREKKSLVTRAKKTLYWRQGMRDILYGWLAVKGTVFHDTTVEAERPDITFPAVVLPNQNELANTANALASAEAASKQTLVQMVHPDWTPADVDAEVQRIYGELGFDLANRARVMLSEPMTSTADFTQQAQQLAQQVKAPRLPTAPAGPGDDEE